MEWGSLFIPWWGVLYLVVLLSLTVAGILEDFKNNPKGACSSAISCFFSYVFVAGYFNENWAAKFGWVLIPMVIYGLMWEFYASVRETGKAQQELQTYDDLTDDEKSFLLNMAVMFNAFVVLPGYLAGVKLCVDLFL
ncbi:MAG: hypothetical protein KDI90_05530 [Alphaproteobacteria bacterium]|nr:hypothetical protein [Alphaproteobacteria bacterium]MCB9975573.1 hypothetical protein [Rhodospirillales bacterium]